MRLSHFAFIALLFLLSSCDALNGNKDLGDNFYLFGGNHDNQEILIYCSGYADGTCRAGTSLVPNFEDTIFKYVSKVKSDSNNIIAETTNKNKEKQYWIVHKKPFENYKDCDNKNCDSIIKSGVFGPFDKEQFLYEKEKHHISLVLE